MITILAIAAAAISAVRSFNRKREADPAGTEVAVTHIRQSTSVVLAVANAVWAVLDALIFLTRQFGGGSSPQTAGNGGKSGFTFGRQVAGDVAGEAS